jgi:HD-GYP domain-containing protein (c-di-GMP phosphodiesterase class II)
MTLIPQQPGEPPYFAVSPLMIFPQAMGRFKVFIKQAGHLVLYASEDETFSLDHLTRLHDNGVVEVYILVDDRSHFDEYLRHNLSRVLLDERLPPDNRARVFHTAAKAMLKDVFAASLPVKRFRPHQLQRLISFVEKSLRFVGLAETFRHLAKLMAHDYKVFDHSLQVFVYAMAILNTYALSEEDMLHAGIGAMLHDVGKLGVDKAVLDKPEPLTPEERRLIQTHPAKGVAMCASVALTPLSTQCILFHHERLDGSGYPAGLGAGDIPLPVMAVALADVFTALTSKRPYAPTLTPFDALSILRDDMRGQFDLEVFKRFVAVLSGAEII